MQPAFLSRFSSSLYYIVSRCKCRKIPTNFKKYNRPLTCYQVKHKDYITYPFYSKIKRLTETGASQGLQRPIPVVHDTKKPPILRQKSGHKETKSASQHREMAIRLFLRKNTFFCHPYMRSLRVIFSMTFFFSAKSGWT